MVWENAMKFTLLFLATCLATVFNGCGPMGPDLTAKWDDPLVRAKIVTDNLSSQLTCPLSDKTPDKISIENDIDAPYKDTNRELKDLGTDFVVKEFFNSKETLFNFLQLVYTKLDEMVKAYKAEKLLDDDAIVFIFKGGNVMRIIANQAFAALPPDPSKFLKDKYSEFFKRSDADFSVLVDSSKLHVLDYEGVMSDLTKRTYETLNDIRDELSANPEKYSNFSQLGESTAGKKLAKYFKELNGLDATKDKDNEKWYKAKFTQFQLQSTRAQVAPLCQYEGQFDYLYQFDGKDKTKIIGEPLNKRSRWIMNTINKALEWPSGLNPKDIIRFYLVRAKVQFEYTYLKDGVAKRMPIGGELIDVSFPHKDDFRLASFFKNMKTGVTTYKITLEETGDTLTMQGESLPGLVTDLYEVLFGQFPRPWQASKYEKRINRIFFFSIVEMLNKFGLGSNTTRNYVSDVLNKVIAPMERVLPLGANSKQQVKVVEKALSDLKRNYPNMALANHFISGLGELVSKRFIESPLDDDEKEFKELLKVVKDNLAVITSLSNLPPEKVNMSGIYDAGMKSLF